MSDTPPVLIKARTWGDMLRDAGVRSWAMILGMGVMTLCAAGLVLIIWKGPWGLDRQRQQLDILGWGFWGTLLIIGLGFIALTGLGVAASVGRGGVSLNVSDEDGNKPLATVTTTTQIDRGDGPSERRDDDRRQEPRRPSTSNDTPPWERR